MGLENVWVVFSWVCGFCFSPLIISSVLTVNPFWAKQPHEGWWARISREMKQKGNARRYPFKVPLWLMLLTYLIASAMFVVPTYLTHHAGGGNDGWNVDPVPLVFAVLAIVFTNIWLLVYLQGSSTNISYVQVLSVITAFMAFFFMLPRHSAWWSLGIIVFDMFWLVKVYLEERCRYPDMPSAVCKHQID